MAQGCRFGLRQSRRVGGGSWPRGGKKRKRGRDSGKVAIAHGSVEFCESTLALVVPSFTFARRKPFLCSLVPNKVEFFYFLLSFSGPPVGHPILFFLVFSEKIGPGRVELTSQCQKVRGAY